MWFELLILIIGIVYGFFHKGKEDLWGLLKMGAIIGLVLGILSGLIAFFFAPGLLSPGIGLAGGIGVFIGIILLAIIIIIGTFIADGLEGLQEK
jgi:hypothetical protein